MTRLRLLLADRNETAAHAARQMGMHESLLSKITNRKREPSLRASRQLQRYFQMPVTALLETVGPNE